MSNIDLRLGDWREVLAEVEECDSVIVDAPYSDRTHDGMHGSVNRRDAGYKSFSPDDVNELAGWSAAVARKWCVSVTDHVLAPVWIERFEAAGLYTFPPLPFVELGKQPRIVGDGPASWTCWVVVARQRRSAMMSWGSLPGAYVPPASIRGKVARDRHIKGGKPLWLMQALIRDYTRPGDLVVDPCAGGGTTLLAAAIEGRRAIGAELDPDTHAKAQKRIAAGYTPCFDFGASA